MLSPEQLYVVSPLFNPQRHDVHIENHRRFARHMLDSGANLISIEHALGVRPHDLQIESPRHTVIEVAGTSELWVKENLINLAAQRLPRDWKYIAWIDADIEFLDKDWVSKTLHALQHYDVIQPWSECIDMGPNGETLQLHRSFMRQYIRGEPRPAQHGYTNTGAAYWHPGYAWASTRRSFEATGGLLDTAILGSADYHMARALIGEGAASVNNQLTAGYKRKVMTWQARSLNAIHRNVGYMEGTIRHFWHGRKADRRYVDRWKILVDHRFDPEDDIHRNMYGVWEIVPQRWQLRDAVRRYFQLRRDNANTVD